jgi:hypothetical protein
MEGLYTYNSGENIKACSSSKLFYVDNHSLCVYWASSNVWILSPLQLAHQVLSNKVAPLEIGRFVVKWLQYSNWNKTSNNFQSKKAPNSSDFCIVYKLDDDWRLSDQNLKVRRGRQNRKYPGETKGSAVISSGKTCNGNVSRKPSTELLSQSILSRFSCFKLSFSVASCNWLWAAFPSESEFSLLIINW